jgi:hypothetical protein
MCKFFVAISMPLDLALSSFTFHSIPAFGTQFLHLAPSSYTWHSGPANGTQFLQMALSSCTYKLIGLQTLNCMVMSCFTFPLNEYPSHNKYYKYKLQISFIHSFIFHRSFTRYGNSDFYNNTKKNKTKQQHTVYTYINCEKFVSEM